MHTPSIRISHPPGAGVIAEGQGDELSGLLLRRAGFLPVSTPRSSWWRTPYDLEPAEQQEMATAAYDMLRAARCEVSIAPELRAPSENAATEPRVAAARARSATTTNPSVPAPEPAHSVARPDATTPGRRP